MIPSWECVSRAFRVQQGALRDASDQTSRKLLSSRAASCKALHSEPTRDEASRGMKTHDNQVKLIICLFFDNKSSMEELLPKGSGKLETEVTEVG